jgi:predicted metalloendopeptidase
MPFGILQSPLYNKDFPAMLNLPAAGLIMAHEFVRIVLVDYYDLD